MKTPDKEGLNVPKYIPGEDVKEHIAYVYKRYENMYNNMENMGLFEEFKEAESLYENNQIKEKEGELSTVNLAVEIEIVETKGAEEKKVLPEAVLKPVYESDRIKVEALQDLIDHIKNKNQDNAKMFEAIEKLNFQ